MHSVAAALMTVSWPPHSPPAFQRPLGVIESLPLSCRLRAVGTCVSRACRQLEPHCAWCRTWRAAVGRWPVDLVAPTKLSRSQHDWLYEAAVPVRSVTIRDDTHGFAGLTLQGVRRLLTAQSCQKRCFAAARMSSGFGAGSEKDATVK